jgi:hypothetical protein
MPTLHYTDEELELAPGWDEHLDSNIRRQIRQAKIDKIEAAQAKAEAAEAKRELVLLKAGVPADAKGEMFVKAYDGPLDAESVKAAYEAVFGAPDPGAGGGTGQLDPNLTAQQRIAQSGGAGAGTSGVISLEERIRSAKTPEELREVIRSAPPEAKIRLAGEDD